MIRTRRSRFLSLSAVLTALLWAAACSSGEFELLGSTRDELLPGAAFTRLLIELRAGSIELREDDGANVVVHAEVLVRPDSAGATAGAGGTPVFADWLVLGESNGAVTLRPARGDSDHELRVHVTVPRGKRAVDLYVFAGSLDAALDGATSLTLRADAGSARCHVGTVTEVLKGRVRTGDIVADIDGSCGGVDIDVAIGAVRLGLPPDSSGAFDLGVDVGGLTGVARFGLSEQRSVTSATAHGQKGNDARTFKVHVGTGQIALH